MRTKKGKPKSPWTKVNYLSSADQSRKKGRLALGSEIAEHNMRHMKCYALAKQTENEVKKKCVFLLCAYDAGKHSFERTE